LFNHQQASLKDYIYLSAMLQLLLFLYTEL